MINVVTGEPGEVSTGSAWNGHVRNPAVVRELGPALRIPPGPAREGLLGRSPGIRVQGIGRIPLPDQYRDRSPSRKTGHPDGNNTPGSGHGTAAGSCGMIRIVSTPPLCPAEETPLVPGERILSWGLSSLGISWIKPGAPSPEMVRGRAPAPGPGRAGDCRQFAAYRPRNRERSACSARQRIWRVVSHEERAHSGGVP